MWMICWKLTGANKSWEIIDGEDAMQVFVSDLVEELGINPDDIIVFPMDSEYK